MSDFTIVRLLPSAGSPGDDTPVLVQQGADQPVERTTLGEVRGSGAPGQPVRAVFSSADAVMTRVELSRKQARHLQRVLPYLLEETLLGEPESYWFSWGEPERLEKDQAVWPVVAIREEQVRALRDYFAEAGLELHGASSDGALLSARAPLRLADGAGMLLMPDSTRAVAVDSGSEKAIADALQMNTGEAADIQGDEAAFEAFREALDGGDFVEILHDNMRPLRYRRESAVAPGPWRPLAWLAACVVLAACLLFGVQQWRYGQAAELAAQQAAAAYVDLFPGDRASSGLRRQFQARLNRLGGSETGSAGFMSLMAPVGQVLAEFRSKGVDSQRLRYDARQGALTVDLQASGFELLESIRAAIDEQGLNAEIATARNEGEGVKARITVERG